MFDSQPKWMTWTGRILSALPVLLFVATGTQALTHGAQVVAGMAHFGYPADRITLIAVLEIGSALLYAIPQTRVLGAVVMTGYLGGAVATHVRIHDPGWPTAIIVGTVIWGGLFLRDSRIRALLPITKG